MWTSLWPRYCSSAEARGVNDDPVLNLVVSHSLVTTVRKLLLRLFGCGDNPHANCVGVAINPRVFRNRGPEENETGLVPSSDEARGVKNEPLRARSGLIRL